MDFAGPTLTLEIRGGLSTLSNTVDLLDEFWRAHDLDPELQADLNIAVEEIASNAIRHGSSASPEPVVLEVTVSAEQVRMQIQDTGIPFNPLHHPPPDPNAPLEQRHAGGLGIFIVMNMMDEVSYERRDGRNSLTLIRKIAQEIPRKRSAEEGA